jgi:hypothetical protein
MIGLGPGASPVRAGDPQPEEIRVDELTTPWGVTVERVHYYLKDGEKVQHGLEEMYSPDGKLEIRSRYAHGEPDGRQEFFYEGIGAKLNEMRYAAGVPVGVWRTWSPDGELLFKGTHKDGEEWEGWFDRKSTSSSGQRHERGETWTIEQWQAGRKVPGSAKEVSCRWRDREPGTLPDHRMFIRWRWSRFMKRGPGVSYDRMPDYADLPGLIEIVAAKREGYQVASDQLTALTRVSFGDPWLQNDEERAEAAGRWRSWWQEVGWDRPAQRARRGVRDAGAWDLVRGGRDLPLPEMPIVIPRAYTLEVHYSSGDYGGVTTESLTIRRDADGAELVREYSTQTQGPVTRERWLPFDPDEADRVVRAIGYLTDRPWLINDEKEIERRFWQPEEKDPDDDGPKIVGRESYHSPYYPGAGFELRDDEGRIWWNADEDSWYGDNPERFNRSHEAAPGVVFPFLARRYPEAARRTGDKPRGWAAD